MRSRIRAIRIRAFPESVGLSANLIIARRRLTPWRDIKQRLETKGDSNGDMEEGGISYIIWGWALFAPALLAARKEAVI